MKKLPTYNVPLYDFSHRKIEAYDVIPYFYRVWKSKQFDMKDVKSINDLKKWIERASKYMFWARCEYEHLIAPWPYKDDSLKDDMKKIDIHTQLMMNIAVLTDVLYKLFEKDITKNVSK